MRASMPSPTSSEHYAPAVDLSTSTTSSASPFGLYESEQPLCLSEDRLIRRACRHSPNCSRSAQTDKPSRRECATHDLHDALRGCPACQSASIVTALTRSPDALRGDAEARTAVRAAYCQLRDVVLAVRDEVDAILSAAWHI